MDDPSNSPGLPAPTGRPAAIAADLGRRIAAGAIAVGEALPPESALLAEFGVSRSTLREALKLLSAKGLVDARPKRGTRVRPPSDWHLLDPEVLAWQFEGAADREAVADLFEIRRMIEPEAAALAAVRADGSARAALVAAFRRFEAGGADEAEDLEIDIAFHRALLRAAGNRYLGPLSAVIETAIRSTARMSIRRPGGLAHSLPQHRAVCDAVMAGDPYTARAAMQVLIGGARADALAVLDAAPGQRGTDP